MMSRLALALPLVLAAFVSAEHQTAPSEGTTPSLDEWYFDVRQGGVAVALPELEAASPEARADAAELSRILFDDIAFASAFKIVDPKKYALAGKARPLDYYAWSSIGADVVVTGTVSKMRDERIVTVEIHGMNEKRVHFATQYTSKGSTRELAHQIADHVLERLTRTTGVARTKIAFASDRADGRKALHLMDYDGHGQRQATQNRHLDFQPRFSPDGSSLSFISYPRKNAAPVLAVLNGEPLFEGPGMIFSASWSPDGASIAFASTRDEPGNAEIYVMRRDGTGVRRLTYHPGIDVSPTWSPTGREIAFTSDRGGSPQVYVMDAEGLNLSRVSMKGSYNSEPAWSPSTTFNELAYATRVAGATFDIVVHDLNTNTIRVLTGGRGLNESPSWAPNGQHLVFTSTRTGTSQIFTIHRTGSNVRQITFDGQNTTPSWGPLPSR